ncbi:hypothetical protein [Hwangdonia sp.]|uniref:hypothetical protein n=1 Tax=Hwangdonia sp. TaxID=1883432 RepID=UPI003AB24701
MELYNVKNNKLESITSKPFKLEKDIQDLIETNTQELFNLEFVKTEFTVDKYRIDSLCYDSDNNSFVIIEYKKGSSYSVIDQGYTYLQLLLNNKSDFLLELSQHFNKVLRVEDVDWSQSKIIFVSPSFNSYQKDSVNFKNLPFELYEIKRFTNGVIILNKHQSTSKESIDSLSNQKTQNVISSVNKEVKVFDEEYHLNKTNSEMGEMWDELKQRLTVLDNIEINPKKHYISLTANNKAIAYFHFRKTSIPIDIPRGNLNVDGTKSKNYFDIDDPKGIAAERSWEWKSGTKGNVYVIKWNKNTDIDYLMFLIKQKYNNLL